MKKVLFLFCAALMLIGFTACGNVNVIPKGYVPVADKDAYEIISLVYPDEIAQGEPFEVVIKAKNISGKRLYRETNSTLLNKDISVTIYNDNYRLFDGIITHTDDYIVKKIRINEKIENTWSFDGTLAIDWQSGADPYERELAPKGVYSMRLSTGHVYTGAIKII